VLAAADGIGWRADIRPWLDFNDAQRPLTDADRDPSERGFGAVHWGHFVTAATIWFVLPLWLGVTRVLRAEVK
jgi:ABC-2 type transport system permease protein